MTALYRCLLKLYPHPHRFKFADEMVAVFAEAETEARCTNIRGRTAFYFREFTGLLSGALREQFCAVDLCARRDLTIGGIMIRQTRCRFPRSAIFMMTFVLVIVLGMIAKIQGVSHFYGKIISGELPHEPLRWPSYYGLISGIAMVFLLAWAVGVALWAIAYAMRRTAAQQLGDFEAWPQLGSRKRVQQKRRQAATTQNRLVKQVPRSLRHA